MAVQAQEWMEIGGGYDYYQYQPVQQLNQRGFIPSMGAFPFQHKDDIDTIVSLQNERLRLALKQQRNQQLVNLMRMLEMKAMVLLQQKEEDLSKASGRAVELEECLRRVAAENETWQRIARENEAMAVALSNTIKQVREAAGCSTSAAEGAESCCEENESSAAAVAVAGGRRRRRGSRGVCRACNTMSSCVVLLPCRHLCACKSCEAFMEFCPVCKSVKKASIEVSLT